MGKKVMIYLDKEYPLESAQLLGIVEKIYEQEDVTVYAAGWMEESQVPEWFDCFLKFQEDARSDYDIRWIAACLEEVFQKYLFDCVIIPATRIGRMVAPVLAMKLESGLTADITNIERRNGKIVMIRPAFSGKIMAEVVSKDSKTIMMSARIGTFSYGGSKKNHMEVEICTPKVNCPKTIHLLEVQEKEPSEDIREAEVLVSGGGGVGRRFEFLYPLAEQLDGMAAASRKVVDSGIAPRSIQVGQSGKIVSPQLYIALGIYGSIQHIEGLKDVKYIISVNTNKYAPICSLSDIVVEGDAIDFVEKISKKLHNA